MKNELTNAVKRQKKVNKSKSRSHVLLTFFTCISFCRTCSLHPQTVHHTQGAAVSAWRVWPVLPCLPSSTLPPGGLFRNYSFNSCCWVPGKLLQDVWQWPLRGQFSDTALLKDICTQMVIRARKCVQAKWNFFFSDMPNSVHDFFVHFQQ